MKLITEINEDVEYVTEGKGEEKKLYIEGVFLQSAIKNRNGRIYPEQVMDKEVARYTNESINSNRAVGELGHPASPQINLDKISHRIVSLRKEGTNYIGKALITKTPMGDIAKGLIESGVRLGVSSRGMGTLKANSQGINEVQGDFKLATAADIVADPSAPDAFINGIMENYNFWFDDRGLLHQEELIQNTRNEIDEAVRKKELNDSKLRIFENFMQKLSKNND